MNELIQDFVEIAKTDIIPDRLKDLEQAVGTTQLRLAAKMLVAWLKSESRPRSLVEWLKGSSRQRVPFDWSSHDLTWRWLKRTLSNPQIAAVFMIAGESIDLNPNLGEQEIREILKYVDIEITTVVRETIRKGSTTIAS